MSVPKRVAVVAALTAAVTLGVTSSGRAQTAPPDFIDFRAPCVAPLHQSVALGFCSPIWKLPLGAPEIAFDNNGVVTYDAGTQLLTVGANVTSVYFDPFGAVNADHLFLNPARMAASRVTIRVKVGNDGKFISGAGDACSVGAFDDFCVIGAVTNPIDGLSYGATTPLLRGRVERVTKAPNAITHAATLYDDFEFYIRITGGDMYDKFFFQKGFDHAVVEAFGFNFPEFLADGVTRDPRHVVWDGTNPFGQSFVENFLFGYMGLTVSDTGGLFDPCNGQISGSITDYFNPTLGIPGAEVQLTGQPNLIPNAAGAYASPASLCVGSYTVNALPPAGYTISGAGTQTITVSTGAGGGNSVVSNVNFKMYSTPIGTSAYTTFGQAAWGTKPRAQNAGQMLATYFPLMYPTGELVIGIPNTVGRYSITETGQAGIQDFLPQEGLPLPLFANYIDPPSRFKIQHKGKYVHHRRLGSLAGETLALELNVRFSAFGLTKSGLGNLKVASGKLAGQTVNQVLATANKVLGGDPLPSTFLPILGYLELESIVERINKNFQAGTTNNGYLIP